MIKKEWTNRIDFTQGRNEVMVRLFSHVKTNKILLMFLLSAFFYLPHHYTWWVLLSMSIKKSKAEDPNYFVFWIMNKNVSFYQFKNGERNTFSKWRQRARNKSHEKWRKKLQLGLNQFFRACFSAFCHLSFSWIVSGTHSHKTEKRKRNSPCSTGIAHRELETEK